MGRGCFTTVGEGGVDPGCVPSSKSLVSRTFSRQDLEGGSGIPGTDQELLEIRLAFGPGNSCGRETELIVRGSWPFPQAKAEAWWRGGLRGACLWGTVEGALGGF